MVPYVYDQSRGRSASSLDLAGDGPGVVGGYVGYPDTRALGREAHRDAPADTLAGTRYDGSLVI
jgi:hypothetical protein